MAKIGAPKENENAAKFDPIYIEKVDKYLKTRKDRNKKFLKQKNNEKGYLMYETRLQVKLPSIEGFASYIGVARKTLYNWEKNYPEFAEALDKIRSEQKERLVNSGLAGDYNPTIAKLILSSNHGMKERVDATTDDKPLENNFSDEQADRIAERIVARRETEDGDTPSKEESD